MQLRTKSYIACLQLACLSFQAFPDVSLETLHCVRPNMTEIEFMASETIGGKNIDESILRLENFLHRIHLVEKRIDNKSVLSAPLEEEATRITNQLLDKFETKSLSTAKKRLEGVLLLLLRAQWKNTHCE